MPTGAGLCPAGAAPYGFGTPDAAPIPGGRIFRNTRTGEGLTSRMLNPVTGDYDVDAYGRITGMTSGQQLVALAIRNVAEPRLRSIQVIGANFQRQVEEVLRVALAPIVARGLIAIVAILVERTGTSRSFARLRWRDLSTNEEQETAI
jgi:hypothetical protein